MMSQIEEHPLGPQPDIALLSRYWHGIGDECQKFMNTPQFTANDNIANTLQQLTATVQQQGRALQQQGAALQQQGAA